MLKSVGIRKHENFLRNEIFFTKTKWPHFNLLFEDIKNISKKIKKKSTIVSLERNSLYGGISLFAPFFKNQNFISVDCISPKLKKRGSYNLVKKKNNLIYSKRSFQFNYKKINLKENSADFIIIPNLMHHISDINIILQQSKKILKKNGGIYIFEPMLRELHQIPEDYFRITPYGFKFLLKKNGFKNFKIQFSGGPFTAIAYCWDQAIQYLPTKQKKTKVNWLKKNFKEFIKLDEKYKKNLVRKNTSFPMSFSITGNL